MSFSLSKRIQSFTHAFRGAITLITTQHNAWIHLIATASVMIAGIIIGVSSTEWIALSLAIALVWMAEAFNTSIEFLADEVSLEKRDRIKKAKDVAAFGVLIASIVSAIIGLIVFLPYLLE